MSNVTLLEISCTCSNCCNFCFQKLLENLKEIEPILEVMTADGGQLAELAPGDAGFKVEDTIAKDMKRFEAVNDAIQKKAEKFRTAKQKSVEVIESSLFS